ncbi:MAG: hypothetical protein IJT08_01250, partial [Alphaproteobacteria bacterium]|nr:hypothetical protein [Alphaproteobacteria bacterium]
EQTNLFMSKRGLDGLNSDKFHASLMLKRENGDVADRNYLTHKERRIPATPLLTYFEGYYVFKRDGFHGSKYAELATKK